ncbi:GNAT family N-acetyltransferase [Micromonospora sp. BQ11]|uniref:GNAT family N-acetyltransferase n=1 Tax=Micromonospora sp. BQ11 TaxID=3452212 RepID=UPI003F8B0D43
MTELEIHAARFDSPAAQRLIRDALADLGARYGGTGDDTPVDAAEFEPPEGAFLIALLDGEPVGCGGWRSHGDTGDTAELKRMYVAPTARGRGVARAVLAAVERFARDHGRKRIVLECGDRQPEAIALYTSSGYEQIPNFGFYKDSPGCVSFGRTL